MKINLENVKYYIRQEEFYEKYKINKDLSNEEIYKKLRRIEYIGNSYATKYCNGEIEYEEYIKFENKMKLEFKKILQIDDNYFFTNSDCRGYFFKIKNNFLEQLQKENIRIYTDFGGYGIIAPEL